MMYYPKLYLFLNKHIYAKTKSLKKNLFCSEPNTNSMILDEFNVNDFFLEKSVNND